MLLPRSNASYECGAQSNASDASKMAKATNRRDFMLAATAVATLPAAQAPLVVPVRRLMDRRAKCTPEELRRFWWTIWPEAVQTFGRCGIQLQTSDAPGEIKLSPAGRPIFVGAERGMINLIMTDHVPGTWDKGRALAGASLMQEGYTLIVIALRYAHGHQFPYLSLNTCVHELLHALLLDVFVSSPKWYQSGERELRDDWYGTGMWLLHNGSTVRESARAYLKRLAASGTGRITGELPLP
jgi:hypothetical protein